MKANKILFTVCLSIALLTGSSCNKWLDLKPLDGIIRQEFWRTKEDLKVGVTSIYSSMVANLGTGTSEKMPETLFIWGEARADMVAGTNFVTNDQRQFIELNIVPSNNLVKWATLYRTINLCNIVLEYAPSVKANDPTLTNEQLNIYIGEALAVRSLMHFYLLRTFGEIPLKVKPTSKDTDIEEIGTSSQRVVIDKLIADLTLAETYLPESYASAGFTPAYDKGRFTKIGVNALLADIYLWDGQYAKCVSTCDKVIAYATANPLNLGLIPVATNSAWSDLVFRIGSSKETIFEISYASLTDGNPFVNLLTKESVRKFIVAENVTSNIFPVDPTNASFVPESRYSTSLNVSNNTILKFGTSDTRLNSNWQVYRYADVMMMKAEALAASGTNGAAVNALILELRTARAAATNTAEIHTDDDYSGLLDYVLRERAREFAFEGKRWYDLLRYAKRNNYGQQGGIGGGLSYLTNIVSLTVPAALQQAALSKLNDKNSHYLPIHQDELRTDSKLVQNPFYR